MTATTVLCPRCSNPLPAEALQTGGTRCPFCETPVEAAVFPAASTVAPAAPVRPALGDEAACFFHGAHVAAFTCHRCGRFLCELCRIDWSGEDLCPACVDAAVQSTHATQLDSSSFRWDSFALFLSTVPALLVFPTIVCAPLALCVAVYSLAARKGPVPRSKARALLAILFSVAAIGGWIAFFLLTFAYLLPGRAIHQ